MRLLLLFLFTISRMLFGDEVEDPSLPDPIVNLEGEPSDIVRGCVNALTGEFTDTVVDIVLPGVESLTLQRTFHRSKDESRGMLGYRWHSNFEVRLYLNDKGLHKNSDRIRTASLKSNGGSLGFDYQTKVKKRIEAFSIAEGLLNYGVTNTGSGYISARTNLKNMKLLWNNGLWEVRDGSGAVKIFNRYGNSEYAVLKKEVRPAGHSIMYSYRDNNELKTVSLMNSSGKKLASYLFVKGDHQLDVISYDEQLTRYHFKNDRIDWVERSSKPWEKYEYDHGRLIKKEAPNNRFLAIEYDVMGSRRAYRLFEPVGVDAKPILTYNFEYNRHHRSTVVKDAVGNKTYYKYEYDRRLRFIDKFTRDKKVYLRDRMFWDGHQLATRVLQDRHEKVLMARTYTYDPSGNVLCESLYGNLTGNPIAPEIDDEGAIIPNKCDCHSKTFEYTTDGYNLVKYETDGEQSISYEYCAGNDLLKAKYYAANGKIYKREFYEYDEDLAPLTFIEDDGNSIGQFNYSGMTQRNIKRFKPRKKFPFCLPEVTEERCVDFALGEEKLIRRIVNEHNNLGKITKQTHYDALGNYAYTLYWEYDAHGNPTKEVNAAGHTILKKYDDNDNLVVEQGPNLNVRKEYAYDFMNRLIREEAVYILEGQRHVITHTYDLLGNRTSTTDPYGSKTEFKYDEFNRLVETIRPPRRDEFGNLYIPVEKKEYDHLNNVNLSQDARGFVTTKLHTVRGQPYLTVYPDGTRETKIYAKNGTVVSETNRDGTVVSYQYDFANRPILKQVTRNGALVEQTSCHYGTFNLLRETDSAGIQTLYSYTPEGWVSKKVRGSEETNYQYDTLGRLVKTIKSYGTDPEDIVVEAKEYNVLDQVVEERVEDHLGNILQKVNYQYDISGKRTQVIETLKDTTAVTTTIYNSYGNVAVVIDPEGNQTVTLHNFSYFNEYGEHVAYSETTDALGTMTCTTCDRTGRAEKIVVKDGHGILQEQVMRYDAAGNLLTTTNLNQGKKITTFYQHDAMNNLVRMVEAWGLPEQRTTTWEYSHNGKKSHHHKVDGNTLRFSYNIKGELTAYNDTNGTFSYVYEYDHANHPIRVHDMLHHTVTFKTYDAEGRLVNEVLGNGLNVGYAYDRMSRPLTLTLPDSSIVSYHYQASQLKSISYGAYTHEYLSYDLANNVLGMKLIGNAGTVDYKYDLRKRRCLIEHKNWKETLDLFDPKGNLVQKTLYDEEESLISAYSYDGKGQLASETGAAFHTYSYDNLGNCILKDGKEQKFNTFNMQCNDEKHLYSYDANGNLTARPPEVFAYDGLNRLISHTKKGQKTDYVYDSENRRLSKHIYTGSEGNWQLETAFRYFYQGRNEIGACDAEGKIVEMRVLGLGRSSEADSTVILKLGDQYYAPLHDHTGSIACLLDPATGQTVESYRYSAFGRPLCDNPLSPWLLSGKRYDQETGFFYFGQRYYDPATSRWTTIDPIGAKDGPNLYTYVQNCPLILFDAYGLMGQSLNDNIYEPVSYEFNLFRSFRTACSLTSNYWLRHFTGRQMPLTYSNTFERLFCYEAESISYGNKGLGGGIGFINGICNDREDFIKTLEMLSNFGKGAKVDGVFNPTKGFALDGLRFLFESMLILQSPAVRLLHKNWNEFFDLYGDNAVYIQNAHSEGTAVVRNALIGYDEKLRKKILVWATAPSRLIEDQYCHTAHHFISWYECVYFFGLTDMLKCSNIHFLTPKVNGFDHGIHSLSFEEELKLGMSIFNEMNFLRDY